MGEMSALVVSQIIISPLLVFEAWLYLRIHRPASRASRWLDWLVIATAVAACAAVLPALTGYESGGNDRIWRPVLATLAAFFIFPITLALGALLRSVLVSKGV